MRLFYFVALLLLYCFMASLAMRTVQNVTTDQLALLRFKAHIIDSYSVLINNWSISYPICSWVGISCGTRHHRVRALNISNMGLRGTISPHLGNLSFLVSLDVSVNNFHGHLPSDLGQLRRLRDINVALNKLSGRFPSWIGIFSKLEILTLYNNSFTGPIPNSLFNLSKLEILSVGANILNGNIPSKIGELPNLKIIYIQSTYLSGSIPWSFYNISSLERIDLGNNSLSGSLPNDLCNRLPKLGSLYLDSNGVFGQIPSNLSKCTHLQHLWLEHNKFTGRLPENVGNLSHLMDLVLGHNNLQGEIPTEIGNLQNLENLVLDINNLSGPIPPTIFNISTITIIILVGNQLTGHVPSTIGDSLPNLKWLFLGMNNLIGAIPNSITNASELTLLDLSINSFSGLVPNNFGNLRFLSLLNLGYNYLTTESSTAEWSFLSSLTNCRYLTELDLNSNLLSGILPPLIGNFSTSLQEFYAYNCELKGSIPQEICNLRGLIALSLHENDLNGTIPTTVGRLQQLQGLDLHDNNLEGTIPDDLCHLKGLNGLWLSENKLSGHIPQCLATLKSLRELHLGSNKLTSGIPSSLWNLEYILQINLSSNSLSGSLPSNVQNLKVLISLDLSRNQISDDIPVTIGVLKDLATLSLAGNQFQGPIPESFGNLVSLESLDLSSNNLTGKIPKSLEALLYLKQLNLSHNMLEGEIPTKGPFRNFLAQSFIYNYALCGSPRLQVPPCKEDKSKGYKKATLLVPKYVLPPIISIVIITIVIIVCVMRRKRSAKNAAQEDLLPVATWRRTSYLDIQRATEGFNECNLLGTGSFGIVYKGILSDGTTVAIKVFKLQVERAVRSFDSECEVLRNIRHRNLLKIHSSCSNLDFKALVLEFMPNGSLEKWLYSHNYFLDTLERLNITIDVALALEYLHHDHSSAPVIHCDLKPSNILLDENMVAHVSDFGISKLLEDGENSVIQTMTMATIGYMAPEYGIEGIISTKCDVYSYGVLLMETFTRKKPTDEMFIGEISLRNWVKHSLPHALTDVVDANLVREEQAFSAKMDCLLSIMHLALDCCMESPEQRISVKDAFAKLQKIRVKFLDDVAATI